MDHCPDCGYLTDEVNISVNTSRRCEGKNFFSGENVIMYDGHTDYGDKMPAIGTYCPRCDQEWIDPSKLVAALKELAIIPFLEIQVTPWMLREIADTLEEDPTNGRTLETTAETVVDITTPAYYRNEED